MYALVEMMIWEGIDKRKFPRVKYKCLISISDNGQSEVFDAYTENIGAGGICVVLGKEFDLFKTAELQIQLYEAAKPIECKGTIVWVIRRSIDDTGAFEYDIGIEFTSISKSDKESIVNLVDEVLKA
jgi:hypothetical protein